MSQTMNHTITVNVAHAKETIPSSSFIGDDIILFERFSEVPMSPDTFRMQSLFLALCTQGKVSYSVDTKKHTAEANDIIIVSEGQLVSDFVMSNDFDGVGILMSYDFFRDTISGVHDLSRLFLFSRSNPVYHLEKEDAEVLIGYCGQIKKKLSDVDHHFRKELVRTLIKSLIYEVSNIIYQNLTPEKKYTTRAESIFTTFIQLVEQNFRMERRVSWYAEKLCITPKYLSESVKAVSRRRPNDWIDIYVTMEIRVLLKNSTMSIKEIAQTLHFANQSFLGKYFKEHVGMSPKEYRRT